ncbi:MAG TPA: FAD-dependent oxidoreductase [Thermoanaerobaculia bacterium]|nr:FAD-dependent oxidoreductase [Thermoanaerobaculia bacterium]
MASEKTVDVVVVGGGLSCLAAARRILQTPGKTVVVLEASQRVGGRLLDAHFGAAGVAELGGEWVAPDQKHVMALIAELGLGTAPTFTDGRTTLNYKGKVTHFSSSDGLPALPALDLAEAAWAFAKLTDMAAAVPLAAPQTAPQGLYWDSLTVEDWITTNLSTDGAKFLVRVSAGGPLGSTARDTSLLHYLFVAQSCGGPLQLILVQGGDLENRVVGGPEQLVKGLAAIVGADRIVLNSPVRKIDQTGLRVLVSTDPATWSAGQVIVAMPPAMTAQIHYEPALPPARAQLNQRVPMGSTIKAFAIYESPFWRRNGLNGIAYSDIGPANAVFDCSPPPPTGGPGIALSLITGDEARFWGAQSPDARRAAVLRALATHYEDPAALHPTDYVDHDWSAQRWIGGGAGMGLPPGVLTEYGPALTARVGRIHWAGTETATDFYGHMDGAISAGERAADAALAQS